MRVSWQQRTDRQWVDLVMVGALIILAIVLLQGAVMAAQPGTEGQGGSRDADDVSIRVLTAARDIRIGVSIEDVEASEATGSPEEGAHVTEVCDETPASMGGIEAGDVIVEFDGERVRSARQLSRLVRETPAGRQVSAVVMRDGRRVTLEVTPEAGPGWMATFEEHLPGLERLRENWTSYVPDMGRMRRELRRALPSGAFDRSADFFPGRARLGVEVMSVSPQLADHFGVEAGVLVATVDADSTAAGAGLQAGDVITAMNGAPVDSPRSLRRRIAELDPGEAFTVEVTREGQVIVLDGQLEGRRPRGRDLEAI